MIILIIGFKILMLFCVEGETLSFRFISNLVLHISFYLFFYILVFLNSD